jgi:hypothetical protein
MPTNAERRDRSPKIHPAFLRKEMDSASAIDLSSLAHELNFLIREQVNIKAAFNDPNNAALPFRGLLGAICFEAGRRYGTRAALGVVQGQDQKERIMSLLVEQ